MLIERGHRILLRLALMRILLDLPGIHRDPFDRLIVSQSLAEPLSLWTNDRVVAQYSDTIRLV